MGWEVQREGQGGRDTVQKLHGHREPFLWCVYNQRIIPSWENVGQHFQQRRQPVPGAPLHIYYITIMI